MAHRISAFVAALILALGLAVAPVAADPIHGAVCPASGPMGQIEGVV